MNTPTISQYAESVCHPYGRFRTLGEPAVERDAYGEPLLYAGGNAAVFKVWLAGRPYALKCYTRPGKRNGMLYAYLAARRTPLLCEVRYLPEELYIYGPDGEGAWYDTVLTEWADGDSLGYAVRRALHHRDTERMAALSRGFDAMVAALLSMPWAHGDLKPGNITVGTDGTMRLLDYDAMYIPGIDAPGAPETGTPQFNHPSRNASFFSKSIDDYPAALISAALRTLAADLSFADGADLTDSLLFTPPELFARRSERYAKALTEAARRGDAVTYRLLALPDTGTSVPRRNHPVRDERKRRAPGRKYRTGTLPARRCMGIRNGRTRNRPSAVRHSSPLYRRARRGGNGRLPSLHRPHGTHGHRGQRIRPSEALPQRCGSRQTGRPVELYRPPGQSGRVTLRQRPDGYPGSRRRRKPVKAVSGVARGTGSRRRRKKSNMPDTVRQETDRTRPVRQGRHATNQQHTMYKAKITREHRTAFIILCDRSGSMAEETRFGGQVMRKAEAVACIINMLLGELIHRSRRDDGIRDYFDIAVLGYSGSGVQPLLPAGDRERFIGIGDLVRLPAPVQQRRMLRTLPGGRQTAVEIGQRQWITPEANGDTPMCRALSAAAVLAGAWCALPRNRDSFPPIVLNITDGEASDATPQTLLAEAGSIKSVATRDGNVLLFNIHLAGSGTQTSAQCFPSNREELPCIRYADLLYDMSSELPACYDDLILASRPGACPPFRAVGYNCPVEELFAMLAIGTASSSFVI